MVSKTSKGYQELGIFLIIVFCFISQILPVIRSGIEYSYGIGFWGPNGHDGIWHLSLIQNITSPFQISHPSISGETLNNYHPFYDILIKSVSWMTGVSPSALLFQISPMVMAMLIIILSYRLGLAIFSNKTAATNLVILNTLGSSLGWIITLFRNGNFYGESTFWSMQSISTQLNPPFALSLVLILALLLLIINQKTRTSIWRQMSVVALTILLPVTKIYGGMIWYLIFSFYSLYQLRQGSSKLFVLFLISIIPAAALFLQYNHVSPGLLEFSPFWFIHSMFQSSDHLFLPKIASFQYNLWLAGKVLTPKYLAVELFGLVIFILGNFSLRTVGVFCPKSKNNPIIIFLLVGILASLVIPLIFIQKGTPWNTIQFLYYSLFLSNILAVGATSRILSKHGSIVQILLLLFLTMGNIGSYQTYLGNPPPTAVTTAELASLKFIKNLPKGIVLTYPYNQYSRQQYSNTPIPIYAYETTSYVPAYSGQVTYLSDEMNLNISGYDWQSRRKASEKFFQQKDKYADRGFLVNSKIDYIYLDGPETQGINFDPSMSLVLLYQQQEQTIYRVNR